MARMILMNRVLCILKDLESGITLMKTADDSKDWTERDVKRMIKKGVVKGYDVAYGGSFVMMDTSEMQYIYLVDEEQCRKVHEEAQALEEGVEDFEDEPHSIWDGAIKGISTNINEGAMYR